MGKFKSFLVTILAVVIGLPIVAVGGIAAYDSIRFGDYYKNAEKLHKIPGIHDDYIPQGLAYSENYKVFLNCGYMHNDSASRIYITNESDDSTKYVSLKYNGELFKKHTGGITVHGEIAYISNSKNLYALSMSDLINASNGDYVNIEAEQKVHTNSSFCFATDTMMYVGEYYDGNKYTTDETHYVKNGEQESHAFVLAYPFIGDLVAPLPLYGYAVANNAQGMCITDSGKIVISTSNGVNPSKLLSYKTNSNTYSTLYDNEDFLLPISISFLGNNELMSEITCPPMNEEIMYKDGYVYVNNESACNKYIYGKFTRAKYIYRIKIS